MARVAAPASGRPGLQMPRIRPWWNDSAWTDFAASVEARATSGATVRPVATRLQRSAARIPELASSPPSKTQIHRPPESKEQRPEPAVPAPDRLRMESADLSDKVFAMRQEWDRLRIELRDLRDQMPTLRRERDELMAAITPLRTELADLQIKDQVLRQLESEIQTLRDQKSSLDREILSELRRSTEGLEIPPTKRGFDDS